MRHRGRTGLVLEWIRLRTQVQLGTFMNRVFGYGPGGGPGTAADLGNGGVPGFAASGPDGDGEAGGGVGKGAGVALEASSPGTALEPGPDPGRAGGMAVPGVVRSTAGEGTGPNSASRATVTGAPGADVKRDIAQHDGAGQHRAHQPATPGRRPPFSRPPGR